MSEEEYKILKLLGERLKKVRLEKELSQHDLSIEAEIPKNQVGRIERAEINTTFLTLHKLAKALKIPISYLITNESDEESNHPKSSL